MAKRIGLFLVFIGLIILSCSTVSDTSDIRWITTQDITQSLEGQPPIHVGFDIDGTVLFSSPGYYYGMKKYSPGSTKYLSMMEFWEEMNNGLDRFSLPKECARELIELHKKRGDSLYFITGRQKTETENLTELLAQTFGITSINEVIFTGSNPKSIPISENNIRIFYGDSDSDIKAALAVGARPVRIIRAGNSTHKPLPEIGNFGEEVLVNSEY
jgi:acid phosphatase (class B)